MVEMQSEKKIYVKIHRSNGEVIVAACDAELLGVVLADPSRKIKFHVDPSYFKGELKTPEELLLDLENASSANLVGDTTVSTAIKSGFIHVDSVLVVNNIPIAFFTRL